MVRIACFASFCIGLFLSSVLWMATPDADRRRAYPHDPARWSGITGVPGALWRAGNAPLFYTAWAAASGGAGLALCTLMPGRIAASLATSAFVGLFTAAHAARRLLRAGPGAIHRCDRRSRAAPLERGDLPRVLFICGSPNQTTQMHQIACTLADIEAWFTPYFTDDPLLRLAVKLGVAEASILGYRRRGLCLDYLNAHGLRVDLCGERNAYDLCVTCNDQVVPRVLERTPWVLVQEGIQEPPDWRTGLWRRMPFIPRYLVGTAIFGLSRRYTRFCVASEGYRRRFLREGVPPEKLVVTGVPNFDDFARHLRNDFPHRGYVLVCTSDARETFLAADRRALLRRVAVIAGGRPVIFKLHPNERVDRATREIATTIPGARVFATGSAEDMVANCDALVTEWSSVTFCGLALAKEVHSLHSLDELRDLLPLQSGRAATDIGAVIRDLLAQSYPGERRDHP